MHSSFGEQDKDNGKLGQPQPSTREQVLELHPHYHRLAYI